MDIYASELVIGGMNHVDKRVDAKFFTSLGGAGEGAKLEYDRSVSTCFVPLIGSNLTYACKCPSALQLSYRPDRYCRRCH
jgi:hypothetical protein